MTLEWRVGVDELRAGLHRLVGEHVVHDAVELIGSGFRRHRPYKRTAARRTHYGKAVRLHSHFLDGIRVGRDVYGALNDIAHQGDPVHADAVPVPPVAVGSGIGDALYREAVGSGANKSTHAWSRGEQSQDAVILDRHVLQGLLVQGQLQTGFLRVQNRDDLPDGDLGGRGPDCQREVETGGLPGCQSDVRFRVLKTGSLDGDFVRSRRQARETVKAARVRD